MCAADTLEPPRLLNYLTAPHVLVWSAVAASSAFPGLFPAQTIVTLPDPNASLETWVHGRRCVSVCEGRGGVLWGEGDGVVVGDAGPGTWAYFNQGKEGCDCCHLRTHLQAEGNRERTAVPKSPSPPPLPGLT